MCLITCSVLAIYGQKRDTVHKYPDGSLNFTTRNKHRGVHGWEAYFPSMFRYGRNGNG